MAAKCKLWLNLSELCDSLIRHCLSLFAVIRCCSEKMILLSLVVVHRYSSLFMYESVGNRGL